VVNSYRAQDKQPDSVSSMLKVFGILQALLGEERKIGILPYEKE